MSVIVEFYLAEDTFIDVVGLQFLCSGCSVQDGGHPFFLTNVSRDQSAVSCIVCYGVHHCAPQNFTISLKLEQSDQ